MKNFLGEKIMFNNNTAFLYILNYVILCLLCEILLDISVCPFNTLQLAFSHIADVHEDFS